MNSRYKTILIALLALLLIGVGVFLFKGGSDSDESSNNDDSSAVTVEKGETEVTGTIACLPYRITIVGQECVKGVKGDDGKMYALNSISVNAIENTMSEGMKVVAIGVFQPANREVDDSSVFKYDGVLVIRILEKQ